MGFGRRQAVLFRVIFIDLLFKFAFHSTHDSGTVYSGGDPRGTWGRTPHSVFASRDGLNLGMADSRIFLGRGPGAGRAAEPSSTPETMQQAGGYPEPGVRSSHLGKERKLSCTYISARPARRSIFRFPFETCFPKVFFVPLPRICVPIVCVSEWRLITS